MRSDKDLHLCQQPAQFVVVADKILYGHLVGELRRLFQNTGFQTRTRGDFTRIGALGACQTAQQGGFPYAVLGYEGDFVALIYAESDIGENHAVAVAFCKILDLQIAYHGAKILKIWLKRKLCLILYVSQRKQMHNMEKIDAETRLRLEEKVVEMLRTVYDPEIPVDIYSLGLVYRIEIDDYANLDVDMTMTAPSCPMADFIVEDARLKLESIEGLNSVNINVVFEPEWNEDMMSEEAKLELGRL